MKNILFYISNTSLGGGTERASISIANELAKDKSYKVYIITAYGIEDNFLFPISDRITVIFLNITGRPIFNLLKINSATRKTISKYKINTVISNEVMSVFFTLFGTRIQKKRVKFIAWDHFNFNTTLGKKGREIARKISAKYADTVVTLTNIDKKLWIEKQQPQAKIISIPNPAPFTYLNNPYSTDSKTIIAIGHLIPVKGYDLLIEIWSKLLDKHPDAKKWKQLVIGNGPEKEKLEGLISKSGLQDNIVLIPATSDIEQYYEQASFITLTSRTEGLPMVLIEALQFGLPAISFFHNEYMYGVSELIKSDSGFLINQFNFDLFAEKMYELISNKKLRESMSKESYKLSEEYRISKVVYSWKKII